MDIGLKLKEIQVTPSSSDCIVHAAAWFLAFRARKFAAGFEIKLRAAPHPKGWGMLRAARPHARFYGIQKSSSFRCPDPLDQNYRNSVFGSQGVLVNLI
jgi:hypothetical protein